MDQGRFDDLTKTLAGSVSRRELLRKLGAGLTGVALAALLPTRAPVAAKATKTVRCKIKEKGRLPTGEKVVAECEVQCEGEAGYCLACRGFDKEEEGLSCWAMCCTSPECGFTKEEAKAFKEENKEQIKDQCQGGTVKEER